MSPDRQWRIQESFKGDHVNGYVDHLLSPILQGTKEGIGALLEGKNRWLDRLLNKCLPDKPISGKSSRLGKGRRAVANQGIRRLILLWNGLIDTVGTAAISVADVINHTQGAVSDALLGKNNWRAIHCNSPWYWWRSAKETLQRSSTKLIGQKQSW